MSYESLICVIPGAPYKQDGVGDMRADKLLKMLWNEKYPNYPVIIKMNSHDFGGYPDIQIREEYWHGFNNDPQTSGDIEREIMVVVDEWNKKVSNGEISELQWKDLRERALLSTELPFLIEY